MAGPGVALRLHKFRESQDSTEQVGPNTSRTKPSRIGRDVNGLYPGQLGRVHLRHSNDLGSDPYRRRSQPLQESPQPPDPPCETYQQSFDLLTLRALNLLGHNPAVMEQSPPQTTYQEQFGLLSPLFSK
ncbi:uncharacterized protein C1orf100-like [Xyrichtys novacula]|nr:uncharacterized protein C1orf100-like [Xyrichtys novacula]